MPVRSVLLALFDWSRFPSASSRPIPPPLLKRTSLPISSLPLAPFEMPSLLLRQVPDQVGLARVFDPDRVVAAAFDPVGEQPVAV
jgi:hypothetical protein